MNFHEVDCRAKVAAMFASTRYIHILNWEAVRPTTVYRKLVSEEAAPFLGFAVDLMRRFMPDADQTPVSLKLNEPAVDRLSALISGWAFTGLAQANVHGSPS